MGSSFSVPTPERVREPVSDKTRLILEYKTIHLSQVQDAYNYWIHGPCDGNIKLTLSAFEEVFSAILADPECHFDNFADLAGLTCNPQEFFLVLCLFLDLEANTMLKRLQFMLKVISSKSSSVSVPSKDEGASDMNAAGVAVKEIQQLVTITLKGMQKLFVLKVPDTIDVNFFVSDCLSSFVTRTNPDLDNSTTAPVAPVIPTLEEVPEVDEIELIDEEASTPPKAKLPTAAMPVPVDSILLQMNELWNWAQDTPEVSSYLHVTKKFNSNSNDNEYSTSETSSTISAMKQLVVDNDTLNKFADGVIDESQYDFLQRKQSVLWTLRIYDMMDETWYNQVPHITGHDNLYTAFEHSILSTTWEDGGGRANPLPIYRNQKGKTTGLKMGSGGGMRQSLYQQSQSQSNINQSSSKSLLARESTIGGVGNNAKSNKGPKQLPPFNLMAASNSVQKDQKHDSQTSSSLLHAGLPVGIPALPNLGNSNQGSILDIFDTSSVCAILASVCPAGVVNDSVVNPPKEHAVVKIQSKSKNKGNDFVKANGQGGEGEEGMKSSVLDKLVPSAMEQEIMKKVQEKRRLLAEISDEQWCSVGLQLANMSLDEIPGCTYLSHRPSLSAATTNSNTNTIILHPEHQVYNAMELAAKRYRSIPVASDPSLPMKVTNVLTGINIVKFLCRHESNLFGNDLIDVPILETGLVRRTRCVPSTANYGTAITMLANMDTESLLIVDNDDNDDNGKVCGIVSNDNTIDLWHNWWSQVNNSGNRCSNQDAQNINSSNNNSSSIENLMNIYKKGNFEHYDGCSTGSHGFDVFNVLEKPLNQCSAVGVHIIPYIYFKEFVPATTLTTTSNGLGSHLRRRKQYDVLRKQQQASGFGALLRKTTKIHLPSKDELYKALLEDTDTSTDEAENQDIGAKVNDNNNISKAVNTIVSSSPKKKGAKKGKRSNLKKAKGKAGNDEEACIDHADPFQTARSRSSSPSTRKTRISFIRNDSDQERRSYTHDPYVDDTDPIAVAAYNVGLEFEDYFMEQEEIRLGELNGDMKSKKSKKGKGKKGSGSGGGTKKENKGKKKKAGAVLTPEDLKAFEYEQKKQLTEQNKENEKIHIELYNLRKEQWYTKHRAIKSTDTLSVALSKMVEYKCTKIYIIDDMSNGKPCGSLSYVDLCRRVLELESSVRFRELEQQRSKRAVDIVIKAA